MFGSYLHRCKWKFLRSMNLRPPKTRLFIIVLSCLLIGSLSSSKANQRVAQNNYQVLGFQDLYFLNFVTCTRQSKKGENHVQLNRLWLQPTTSVIELKRNFKIILSGVKSKELGILGQKSFQYFCCYFAKSMIS